MSTVTSVNELCPWVCLFVCLCLITLKLMKHLYGMFMLVGTFGKGLDDTEDTKRPEVSTVPLSMTLGMWLRLL